VYANEEGLLKNLPPNTAATIIFEYPLVGNVVMVSHTDEMAKELERPTDENDDDVLSPLDDMMDRHRERLESKNEEPPRFYERLDNYDPAGH
jgi:hypothetical protein